MTETVDSREIKPFVLRDHTDSRFKTMRLSVNIFTPLSKEYAALNGILPGLVTRASREYPEFHLLNRRLSELYGASLSTGVRKMGGFQCLSVSVSGLSSKYAFGGEDMLRELSSLLYSVIFTPLKDENGLFPQKHFEQEQRQLLELKDAEYNDKISYSHAKCESILFEGTGADMDRYGSREDIERIDSKKLPERWDELLRNSHIEIFAHGDCTPNIKDISSHFDGFGAAIDLTPIPFTKPVAKKVTEAQPLSQSKLSMGFRVDSGADERLLYQLMSAVLGGVPSSKLFQNVREKLGLCYYCSSAFSPLSRALYIESGVETANLEKTQEAVFEQLEELKNGKITEEELLAAKLALQNAYRSVRESFHATENWYISQLFSDTAMSPEEAREKIMTYTAEDVSRAANQLDLGAVFTLRGEGV